MSHPGTESSTPPAPAHAHAHVYAAEEVEARFAEWLARKATDGLDFNDALYARRDFYNPNLASRLLSLAGLSECSGTNLPPAVFDPSLARLGRFDYEAVAAEQKAAWEEAEARHQSASASRKRR